MQSRDSVCWTSMDAMRISRMCRVALAICCTLVGWFALWRVMSAPQAAGGTEAMLLIGGWGLGLLPIQAVPYERRLTWSQLSASWRDRGSHKQPDHPAPYRYAARPGSCWQRGHQ